MTFLNIEYTQTDSELYLKYGGQSSAQPVNLTLELESGRLHAEAWGNIGGGCSEAAFHDRHLEWTIPALRVKAFRALVDGIAPKLQEILDDSEVDWNGSNWVGRLGDSAQEIYEQLSQRIDSVQWESSEVWEPWEAAVFFEPVALDDIGLSAQSTEAEIESAADNEIESAEVVLDRDDVIEHPTEWVESERAEAIADAEV